MITGKDIKKELKIIDVVYKNEEATTNEILRAILKSNDLIVKLLTNIRSNQVKLMKHEGVEFEKGEDDESRE